MSMNNNYRFQVTEDYHDEPVDTLPHKALLIGFADKTTAHGISHVYLARGSIKKGIWIVFSLVSVGLFLYSTQALFEKYFNWPVAVKVDVEQKIELTFPAITVCNMNPLLATQVRENGELSILTKQANTSAVHRGKRAIKNNLITTFTTNSPNTNSPDSIEDITTTGTLLGSNEKITKGIEVDEHEDSSQKITNDQGEEIEENFELITKTTQYVALLSEHEQFKLGHQVQDFILRCSYAGYKCSTPEREFYQFYNMKYGNCFVFNSGWNETSKSILYKSRRTGPQFGLNLIINIDQEEYVGELADTAGIRVVIHSQNTMPFPEDQGITLQPGVNSNVGMREERIDRLSSPYSNCTSETYTRDNAYSKVYPVEYTVQACRKTCYQERTMETCGCANVQYPLKGTSFTRRNITVCDEIRPEIDSCVQSLQNDFQQGKLTCDCPEACHEKMYTTTVSTGEWPSDAAQTIVNSHVSHNKKAQAIIAESVIDDMVFKKNFAKVTIYFEEFNLKTVEESVLYPPGQFVSDIGGILGLFIGFSVLTIVEFIEVFLDSLLLCCVKKFSTKKHSVSHTKVKLAFQDTKK